MNMNLLQDAFKQVMPEQFSAKKPQIPAREHFRKFLKFLIFSILVLIKTKVACDTSNYR